MSLSQDLLQAFDDLNGLHPGFRPAHAKGILLAGEFVPSADAAKLTRAPHAQRKSTPVTVRFSDFAGFPAVADNDPANSSPRGIAIRFHLAEHVHTDIVGHSANGFPARTAEEFLEFLRAAKQSPADAPKPTPIEVFLGAHPKALTFLQIPKPIPSSFAKESFYAVSAFRFVNADGAARYGRFRVLPEGGVEYLDEAAAAAKSANFLFDEIAERVGKGPVKLRIVVQLAEPGDAVDDATAVWPETRTLLDFGGVTLTGVAPNGAAEQQHIIFDPVARVDGIEPSGDPLAEQRADLYLLSGRRRRRAGAQ